MDISLVSDPTANAGFKVITENSASIKLFGDGTITRPLRAEALGGFGGGGITSFNGRPGPAIVPLIGDYSFAMISNIPTTLSGHNIGDGVSTGTVYTNPAFIGALAWNKITGTPTSLASYGILDGVSITGSQTLTNKILTSPNFNFGTDADGDIMVRIGGVYTRLAAGGNGTVLKMTSGLPAWGTDLTGGGGGGGTVDTVFGRPGPNIVQQAGDYTFAQLGAKPTDIAGYGITDAISLTGAQTLSNKILTAPVINVGSDVTGDMYYRSGTTLTRIPVGALNSQLTVNGSGIPTWKNPQYITVSALRASSSPILDRPYYITDRYEEGPFWYDVSDTTTLEDGTPNSGTVIVTIGNHRFKRIYDGILQGTWYGCRPDYAPSGSTMTGSNTTTGVDKMLTASISSQPCELNHYGGLGYLFSTPLTIWDSTKARFLRIRANTFHSSSFVKARNSTGTYHKFRQEGNATGMLNIATHTRTTYDAGTSPDYTTFLNTYIDVEDCAKTDWEMGVVDGFNKAIRIASGNNPENGGQENRFSFKWLRRNSYGLYNESIDGGSYQDKNYFFGGRIGGDRAIYFEGNAAGPTKTGVFTSNVFHNVLIELANYGITGTGVVRYNKFGVNTEGGFASGVMSGIFYDLQSGATSNTFSSTGILEYAHFGRETSPGSGVWTPTLGEFPLSYGTPLYTSTGRTFSSAIIGSSNVGRVTVFGTGYGYNSGDVNLLPGNVDVIEIIPRRNLTNERKPSEFAKVRWEGVFHTLTFDGKYQAISGSAATGTILIPSKWVRITSTAPAVVLTLDSTQCFDGMYFWLEQTTANTVEIQRSDTSAIILANTVINSTGKWLVRYQNTTLTADKIGGTAGVSGVTTPLAVGSAPNANAMTISGVNINLQPANLTNPGVLIPNFQQIGGRKQWTANVTGAPPIQHIFDGSITAAANNDLLVGIDINPTFVDNAFTGVKHVALRTHNIRLHDQANATFPVMDFKPIVNGVSIFPNTHTGLSHTLFQISSGDATKATYLQLGKSGVTTGGVVVDGSNVLLVTEKTSEGFRFRKNVGFASPDFVTTPTGSDLMGIFSTGNVLIQTGGTYTDNGYKLDIQGTTRTTSYIDLGILTADPAINNGRFYYNSVLGKYRACEGGAWTNMIAPGGGGGGDASTNTATSVVNEVWLFADTTGKLAKRSTGSGFAKLTSGVLSVQASININTETTANLNVDRINASGYTGSGGLFLREDGAWAAAGGGGSMVMGIIDGAGSANANGAFISGSTIYLRTATGTTGGVLSDDAVGQTIGGDKVWAGMHTWRLGTTTLVPWKFNASSQLKSVSDIAGAIEWDGFDMYKTDNDLARDKFVSATNTVILSGNKEWQANYIRPGYGGLGANLTTTNASATYTASVDDGCILCTYSGGGTQAITLPTAVGKDKQEVTILSRASGKSVNISNGDPLGGNSTAVTPAGIKYRSNNTNWIIVGKW